MIIFDLDGTLADCEHRRHFVDPTKIINPKYNNSDWIKSLSPEGDFLGYVNIREQKKFTPDWKSFYEAYDEDKPIEPVIKYWADQISLGALGSHMIWSGRCESVREKTEKWLYKHLLCFESHQLKMRPMGDSTPDNVLKEKWLDEVIVQGEEIEFVFDNRPKVIRMWRRRGIFVFNCCQHIHAF